MDGAIRIPSLRARLKAQKSGKPFASQIGNLFERALFLEQVRSAWNNLEFLLRAEMFQRFTVHFDDR
jgi:hypothetical protein